VTLNNCNTPPGVVIDAPMDGEVWQVRAKAAGVTQRLLARITAKSENTISRQLRGEFGAVPGYLIAIILAFEMLDAEQRAAWIAAIDRELGR
jgi:hypothetical protein